MDILFVQKGILYYLLSKDLLLLFCFVLFE